jgi:hypothetical protein
VAAVTGRPLVTGTDLDVAVRVQDFLGSTAQREFVRPRRRNWARLIAKVWQERPDLCRGCGQELKIISAVSSPQQDEVIEK